jgi:branched-chain amino acid transport system substrate-binding protein
MKKIIWTIIILVIILIVLSVNVQKEPKTIKIGAIFPLTGGLASYGEPAQKVAKLAMDEINTKGGIDGKKLEINFQDHKCDPKIAVSTFQQLKSSEDIKIYMGVGCSGAVLSIAPQLEDSILLVSAVSSPKVTGVSPLVFRNYASDADESRLFAEYIKNKNLKSLSSLYEETDYAKGLVLNLEKNLEGYEIEINKEGFVSGATDIKTQVTKIKSLNADIVFVSVQTVTTGDLVLGEMLKQNFKPKNLIVNENILKSKNLLEKYPGLLEKAVSADYITNGSSKLDELLSKYKAKYGEDCPQINICATVYDNVYLLADAVEKEGYDSKKIGEYLGKVSFDGVSGQIGFDTNNDRKNAGYTLFEIVGDAINKIN